MRTTDNLNIRTLKPLPTPKAFKAEIPLSEEAALLVLESRAAVQNILTRRDNRPMVIVGPCSAHDYDAVMDYAERLRTLRDEIGSKILIIMRAYFEKPRTSLGWKGLLYDPLLDESDDIETGLRMSRKILVEITRMGLPTATELLDPIVPQYLCDLVTWAAIGARTAESQIHRQMASGLSMPIGFKNSTDGNLDVAIDSIRSAANPHAFLGITDDGRAAVATTRGNRHGHLVLRGGIGSPNYASEYVAFAEIKLRKAGISNGILIDCSHANSGKNYKRQNHVFHDVCDQIHAGSQMLCGMMLESFIHEGNQPLPHPPTNLQYGVSITDACIGWDETAELLRYLASSSS
jgi:3-deoxy-7-phosphoheptulonate synthase